MSEDLSRGNDAPAPGRSTDEWIGMLAASEGLSRAEIVERMVASYWTLKEMDGMMEQLEMGGLDGPADDWAAELEASLSGGRAGYEELAERLDRLEGEHDAVEQRVIEEFGYLRTIITRLLQRTEALEAGGGADPRRDADEKRLVDLKRSAGRHGVRSASCDHCGTSVDLALLATPDCPQCDRRFTSLQPSTRPFGLGSATLTVEATGTTAADRRADDG